MAARARVGDSGHLPAQPAPAFAPGPSALTGDEAPAATPPHELQELVEDRLGAMVLPEPPVEGRWPPAATLGFVLVTCGGFWAAVFLLASRLG